MEQNIRPFDDSSDSEEEVYMLGRLSPYTLVVTQHRALRLNRGLLGVHDKILPSDLGPLLEPDGQSIA